MEKEEVKLGDMEELAEQNKKAILESGNYAMLEIIVGKDNEMPYCNVVFKNCSALELGALLKVARQECELIEDKFPEAKIASDFFGLKDIGTVERNIKNGAEDM